MPAPSPRPTVPHSITPNTPAVNDTDPQPQPQPPTIIQNTDMKQMMVMAFMMGLFMIVMLGGLLVVGGVLLYKFGPAVNPLNPSVNYDPAWVKVGEEYSKLLGPTYAPAWEGLANDMDRGLPFSQAWKTLSDKWEADRGTTYGAKIGSGLNSIIPNGTKDELITPSQRQAMSKSARGLAKGLSGN